MPRFPLHAALTSFLLLVAGCVAPVADEPTGRPVSVSISNQDDVSYAVRIVLASDDVDGVRVTYSNGSSRTYDVSTLTALPAEATREATDLEPLGEDLRSERFLVPANGGVGKTFEDVPRDARLIYVVTTAGDDATLRSQGVARCATPDARFEFSLSIDSNGSISASTHCRLDGTAGG